MDLKELLGETYKEGMTVDEINEALANVQMPKDNAAELAKLKDSVTRANSEAAKYKKELNDRLSEEEKKAKEDAEKWEKIEKERNELLREKNISTHKAKFLENGYTADDAEKSATALVDGDFNTVFNLLGQFRSNLEKKFKAENIDKTPKPQGGGAESVPPTKEQFDAMTYTQQLELKRSQPEVYNSLTGG